MVRVFRVVRPVATVRFRVEPYPEPTREFGPVANTRRESFPPNDDDRYYELPPTGSTHTGVTE